MDVAPERCAIVGDTPVDILTARNANMHAVAITWGFRSNDELAELDIGGPELFEGPGEAFAGASAGTAAEHTQDAAGHTRRQRQTRIQSVPNLRK